MKPEHHIVRDVIAAQYWMEDWAFGRAIAKADQFIDLLERREAEEQKKTAERPMMDAELREEERLRKANDPVGSGLPTRFREGTWGLVEDANGLWMHSGEVMDCIDDRDRTIVELKAENTRLDAEWKQAHYTNEALLSERTRLKAENERLKAVKIQITV